MQYQIESTFVITIISSCGVWLRSMWDRVVESSNEREHAMNNPMLQNLPTDGEKQSIFHTLAILNSRSIWKCIQWKKDKRNSHISKSIDIKGLITTSAWCINPQIFALSINQIILHSLRKKIYMRKTEWWRWNRCQLYLDVPEQLDAKVLFSKFLSD